MNSIGLALITVRFIGIIMFTNQAPPDGSVRAIMPWVPVATSSVRTGRAAAHAISADDGIEQHTAIIAIENGIPQSAGWSIKTLPPPLSLPYVALSGEQVELISADTDSAPTDPPAGLRKVTPKNGCHGCTTIMDKRFLPPYRGAAAVVRLNHGTPKACGTDLVDANGHHKIIPRVDTLLELSDEGPLVITATKFGATPKALIVPPGATVYIANIPSHFLQTGKEEDMGLPHSRAYFDMLVKNADAANYELTASAASGVCTSSMLPVPPPPPSSPWSGVAQRARPAGTGVDTQPICTGGTCIVAFMTADCSNSAWP